MSGNGIIYQKNIKNKVHHGKNIIQDGTINIVLLKNSCISLFEFLLNLGLYNVCSAKNLVFNPSVLFASNDKFLIILIMVYMVTGCGTVGGAVSGAGQDLSKAGEWIKTR